jgi:hypothetical protein
MPETQQNLFTMIVVHPLTDLGVKKILPDWNSPLQKSTMVREGIPL